jgi:proteic killer suppression protein
VNITFRNRKIAKIVNDDRLLKREFGSIRAEKIKQRLTQLKYAITLEDVRNMPGNFHELTNERKGQWACDLDQPYRLIYTPQENPIPVNDNGQYIWSRIQGVEVIEIINYHKEK